MSDITLFEYDGQSISFEFADGNKMVNATQMEQPFGKPVGNFLRLKETKQYIQLLEERYSDLNIAQNREVLRVIKGGDAAEGLQGTWMDEKLALKFASWLSPVLNFGFMTAFRSCWQPVKHDCRASPRLASRPPCAYWQNNGRNKKK